ncbi:MAG TPA: extracellular solute-binding protein, partial [Beutenbergiaceae bacterium]|nr:extracellular solute-binding protein [Beutenbergiaceae bacterium]
MTAHSRKTSTVGLLAASMFVLAGCVTAGTSDGEEENGEREVSAEVTDEEVTLRLAYTDDPPTEALVEGFIEEHPNVTIETEQTDFGNYITSITRSMSSDSAPDIAQYNPGAMRSLVPAGHVLELSDYSELYGWEESFPPASLEQLMSDDDAQQFGTGGLYAAPGALSVLGVYYNRDMLADAGVDELPTTIDEFTEAMAAVADNGDDPLSLGALEVGAIHLWNAVLNSVGDSQEYLDWVYGAPEATIETDAAARATELFDEWVEDGFITEGANATSDADALANFTAGNAAFHVTGNWAAAAVDDEMDDAGFFVLPGAEAGSAPVASGSSVAYSISSASEHPDVAAAFLDYLSSPEAAAIQIDTGFMPVDTEADIATDGLLGDIADSFAPVAEQSNIVPFPDFAAPGMIDSLTGGLQG